MRLWIRAILTAFSGLALAAGCAAGANETSTTASGPGTGGSGGTGAGGNGGGMGGAACVPTKEVCDGKDNNCDGTTDEGCECAEGETQDCYSGAEGTQGIGECAPGTQTCDKKTNKFAPCKNDVVPKTETCNGKDDDCNGATDDLPDITCGFGACQSTSAACEAGAPKTCTPGMPSNEVCDGLDNDCDQLVDETFPNMDMACSTGQLGVCAPGTLQCVMAQETCVPKKTSKPELCDGLDNDCNGQVDDAVPGTGGSCTTGLPGICGQGIIDCQGGSIDCYSIVPPAAETCDGADNDCDGQIDQGDPGGGGACNTGVPGICSAGILHCLSGALTCVATKQPQVETCNNTDDDCDGQIDENDPGGNVSCTTGLQGVCSAGTKHCVNGGLACQANLQPSAEMCDALDNDCDGQIDDGNPGGGAACSTGQQGACGAGTITCQGGALSCKQNVLAMAGELCGNGTDDDCNGQGDDPTVTVYFNEPFANNSAGWTFTTPVSPANQPWQIGATAVSSGQTSGFPDPALDNTPTADNGVAGVVLGGNAPKVVTNPLYLYVTSPVLDTSAASTLYLEYRRWLNSDFVPYMQNSIEIYNGSSWAILFQTGGAPALSDNSWKKFQYDISAYKSATMQVRFGYRVGQTNLLKTVSSWNIDDVQILSGPCN